MFSSHRLLLSKAVPTARLLSNSFDLIDQLLYKLRESRVIVGLWRSLRHRAMTRWRRLNPLAYRISGFSGRKPDITSTHKKNPVPATPENESTGTG